MYKKQLRFQKFACLFAIVAAAVSFVYSLGMITDIYDSLYSSMMNPNDLTQTYIPGSIIYYDMQDFNKLFLYAAIGLILLAALLYLTNTHIRRRYYIGNIVATVLYGAGAVAVCVWSHLQISAFKVQFLTTVDFEAMKTFSEMWGTPYVDSTFLLDLHYGVAAMLLLSVAALVGNLVWKFSMMRQEQQLIDAGKEAAV